METFAKPVSGYKAEANMEGNYFVLLSDDLASESERVNTQRYVPEIFTCPNKTTHMSCEHPLFYFREIRILREQIIINMQNFK